MEGTSAVPRKEEILTHLRSRGVLIGRHFEIAIDEIAWVEYFALETRQPTKPGKKEHGG